LEIYGELYGTTLISNGQLTQQGANLLFHPAQLNIAVRFNADGTFFDAEVTSGPNNGVRYYQFGNDGTGVIDLQNELTNLEGLNLLLLNNINPEGLYDISDMSDILQSASSTEPIQRGWQGVSASWDPGATETPGMTVSHTMTWFANWSFPGLGIHVAKGQPIGTIQHEYGHYLQYQQIGIIQYTFGVALPSAWNLLFGTDHDYQPYELQATTMAQDFYQTNSQVGNSNYPNYYTNPELLPQPQPYDYPNVENGLASGFH
jgi:hypothetical protein